MNRQQLVEKLRELGMTQYQAHAYVGAVSLGTTRPPDLAEEADIPRARVYDVIDHLDELGLVEVHSRSGGKEVEALPPDVALEEYKNRRIDDLTDTIQSVTSGLSPHYDRGESTEGFMTMLRREEAALRHIRQAANEAEWWLTLILPESMYAEVADEVTEAVERGTTVRLVLRNADTDRDFPDGMSVRYRLLSNILVVADRSYVVFSSTAPSSAPLPYLVIREANLAHLFQNYGVHIWPYLESLHETTGYPRWYLEPRYAILDMGDELRENTYTARIAGRWTGDRYMSEWTGTIVDCELTEPSDNPMSAFLGSAKLRVDIGDEVVDVGGWKALSDQIAAHAIEIVPA
jgi:sugar-specific transcriptional regulator TrmB